MSVELSNIKGKSIRFSNWNWFQVICKARNNGWNPIGTVLNVDDGKDHPDLLIGYVALHPCDADLDNSEDKVIIKVTNLETDGDTALFVAQTINRGIPEPDWSGDYTTNDGQIMLKEDAHNMAEALSSSIEVEDWKDWGDHVEVIHELIKILNDGPCVIT
jgi:hypothetical protein